MEAQDVALIAEVSKQDEGLKKLWEEHKRFEHELDELNQRAHLTPEEAIERKRIKIRKLAGKDKIEEILTQYRS